MTRLSIRLVAAMKAKTVVFAQAFADFVSGEPSVFGRNEGEDSCLRAAVRVFGADADLRLAAMKAKTVVFAQFGTMATPESYGTGPQ